MTSAPCCANIDAISDDICDGNERPTPQCRRAISTTWQQTYRPHFASAHSCNATMTCGTLACWTAFRPLPWSGTCGPWVVPRFRAFTGTGYYILSSGRQRVPLRYRGERAVLI